MMDTSKEYINMCEKAVEVQEEWKIKEGDYISIGDYGLGEEVYVIHYPFKGSFYEDYALTWLPKQDQLQEMIETKSLTLQGRLAYFSMCLEDSTNKGSYIDEETQKLKLYSMEQLWLAFVMQEKYGKTWNGKMWGIKS